MLEKTLQAACAPLRYWIAGDADLPWLIATVGAGLDHRSFLPLAAHLQQRFRVLLWDAPGHGESQPLRGGFTLEQCVFGLEQILDAERIDTAVFLGFSFGGVVHQLLAVRRPGAFKAMILYACLCPAVKRVPIPGWLAPLLVWVMFGLPSWDRARALFVKQSSNREPVRREINLQLEQTGRATFLAAARAMLIAAGRALPARWQAPTLFIYGAQDEHKRDFAGMLRQLLRVYPDAVIATIEGAAHCAHAEEPEAFHRHLDRFLDRLQAPARAAV